MLLPRYLVVVSLSVLSVVAISCGGGGGSSSTTSSSSSSSGGTVSPTAVLSDNVWLAAWTPETSSGQDVSADGTVMYFSIPGGVSAARADGVISPSMAHYVPTACFQVKYGNCLAKWRGYAWSDYSQSTLITIGIMQYYLNFIESNGFCGSGLKDMILSMLWKDMGGIAMMYFSAMTDFQGVAFTGLELQDTQASPPKQSTYSTPLNFRAAPITDTAAFATCP